MTQVKASLPGRDPVWAGGVINDLEWAGGVTVIAITGDLFPRSIEQVFYGFQVEYKRRPTGAPLRFFVVRHHRDPPLG